MIYLSRFIVLFWVIFSGTNMFAQGPDCASAIPAVLGVNTADGPSSGGGFQNVCAFPGPGTNADWYTYFATENASVTITSCLEGVDTRVSVYDGSCAKLNCVASNDDFCEVSPGGNVYASQITFTALAGTTYYIQWDDLWSTDGFDWWLNGDPLQCPDLLLNVGDACDYVGTDDGVVDDSCTCVEVVAPDCATLLMPDDGATGVETDANNNDGVTISWSLNGFQPIDGVNLYWASAPGPPVFIAALGPQSNGAIIFDTHPGEFVWMAVPFNSAGEATGCDVFSFDTYVTQTPDCPELTSPSDGESDVVLDGDTVTLTWINDPTTAQLINYNEVYWGTDPSDMILLGVVAADAESVEIINLEHGITYYWSIVPFIFQGPFMVDCSVFSFTVEGDVDCPELGFNGLNFGNYCDDGDPDTAFDEVAADECLCAGIPVPDNAICENATAIGVGEILGAMIVGGGGTTNSCFPGSPTTANNSLWYSYTPLANGNVTVDATIDLDEPDTRLSIFTGSCAALTCYAANDDASAEVYSSMVSFDVIAGTTYLIEWDDAWFGTEFDFELSFVPDVTCETDLNGDGFTNGADFSIFLGNYTLPCEFPPCATDFNDDGVTDGDDFAIILGNFNSPCN